MFHLPRVGVVLLTLAIVWAALPATADPIPNNSPRGARG